MIKKQVDWDVRVVPSTENQGNPVPMLKAGYPADDGWELVSTAVAQVSANTIFIMYTFARYEYEQEGGVDTVGGELTMSGVTEIGSVKRGPGRPKKVEVEPA